MFSIDKNLFYIPLFRYCFIIFYKTKSTKNQHDYNFIKLTAEKRESGERCAYLCVIKIDL